MSINLTCVSYHSLENNEAGDGFQIFISMLSFLLYILCDLPVPRELLFLSCLLPPAGESQRETVEISIWNSSINCTKDWNKNQKYFLKASYPWRNEDSIKLLSLSISWCSLTNLNYRSNSSHSSHSVNLMA